jgi:hypothetical protein
MEMDYTLYNESANNRVGTYDIVSNPSYLSVRLYGFFIGYIDKENINIIRKKKDR